VSPQEKHLYNASKSHFKSHTEPSRTPEALNPMNKYRCMSLETTPVAYTDYLDGLVRWCLRSPKKAREKGSTNGSTFIPLYSELMDS